jgi:Phage integrase family
MSNSPRHRPGASPTMRNRGLQWTDISDDQLVVSRTVWQGQVGPTKTDARNAAMPLLPVVKDALAVHRKNNPATTWVFQGPMGRPLDLATLGSKPIKAVLLKAGMTWHGWHALRRGFGTTLHAAGVQDKIIQTLMRHTSLSVTMEHYVKALPAANVAAVKRLGNSFGNENAENPYGGVAERLKAAVLKTVRPERVSWVRIPPPPPKFRFSFHRLARSLLNLYAFCTRCSRHWYRM